MEDLKQLSLSDLFDLLIEQTNKHAHLRALGATSEQMMASREILRNLQAEIALRKEEKTDQGNLSSQDKSAFEKTK
jgi:hypothetical protein